MLGKGNQLYGPSLERLKRRVGLVPLRKRNQQYITWPKRPQSRQQEEEEDRNGNNNNKDDDDNNVVRLKRSRLSLGDSMSQRERDQLEDVGSPSVLDAATIEAVFEARRLLNIRLPDTTNTTTTTTTNTNNISTSRSLFLIGRHQPLSSALGALPIGNISSSTTIATATTTATTTATPLAAPLAAAAPPGSKRLGGLTDPFSSGNNKNRRSIGSIKNHFSSELKKKT
jgi:hypothetical protein